MALKKKSLDRISDLSNPILHHILSFLDTRHAVRTSVLSSRWRDLWKSMSHLSFDKKNTPHNHRFASFVYQVLLLGKTSDVHTFSLLSIDDFDVPHLYNWIIAAIERNVQVIDIFTKVNLKKPVKLPNRLFTCQTLITLHLSLCNKIALELPEIVSLPCLEALYLEDVCFRDAGAASKFIASCPSLSMLDLSLCYFDVEGSFVIKAPKLIYLGIKAEELVDFHKSKISVYAPNLELVCLDDDLKREYSVEEEFSHLRFAQIYLRINRKAKFVPFEILGIHEDEKKEYVRRTTSLLEAVRNTEKLSLNHWTLLVAFAPHAVLECQSLQPLQFQNLKYLHLETWLSTDCFYAIIELLRISPKIETLSLHIIKDGLSGKPVNWNGEIFSSTSVVSEGNEFPKQCTFHHLEVVEIHGAIGCMNELKLLEIVLKNAVVLKKMVVWTIDGMPYDRKKGLMNFSKMLLGIPRASSTAAILLFQEL